MNRIKPFWIALAVFGIIFTILFSVRLDLLNRLYTGQKNVSFPSMEDLPEKDTWMNIFQNGRKIGFSQTTFSKTEKGYWLVEDIHLRINTMGLAQDIHLKTGGRLNPDLTLSSFDFKINSGRFSFETKGTVAGDLLSVQTHSFGSDRKINIKVKEKIYIVPAIFKAVTASDLEAGDELAFQIFDPATMGSETVVVRVIGREEIMSMGRMQTATKVSLVFKGMNQLAWVAKNGHVLKEKGLLGISLEKATREDALFGLPAQAGDDLTEFASVPSNVLFDHAAALTLLEVEIGGIKTDAVNLRGGRQTFSGNLLSIEKETLSGLPHVLDIDKLPDMERDFLKPTWFVQSDDHRIRALVKQIVLPDEAPYKKVSKLIAWMNKNIEKRPVLSVPDALSTLENRMGDCNEHAVLLAALARAAGVPAKIETGLVYLDGRFYYHAWNLLYLGKWITADALFGQIPADVTHIRFSSGAQNQQLDLMNIIGRLKLKVRSFR